MDVISSIWSSLNLNVVKILMLFLFKLQILIIQYFGEKKNNILFWVSSLFSKEEDFSIV